MPEKEAWFRNNDGAEFSCNEGSVAFDLMSKDGSFTLIDGAGGSEVETQAEPEIETEGVTYSEDDAIAQNDGKDVNEDSAVSDQPSAKQASAKAPAKPKSGGAKATK